MQDQFWYPQLPADKNSSEVVSAALNKFASLFECGHSEFEKPPLSSAGPKDLFNLSSLLDPEVEWPNPVIVLGTCSEGKAIEYSWKQLGLNLFDLPWFESEKAFHYVNATALLENVGALELLLSDQNIESDLGKASEQLRWAQCHRLAKMVQDAVGHGDRSYFQKKSWSNIRKKVNGIVENNKFSEIKCRGGKNIKKKVSNLPEKDESMSEPERLKYARKVSDIDCRVHRLAPAIYFDKSSIREPKFDHVIVLEDIGEFRKELIKDIREMMPNAEVHVADHEKSKEQRILVDNDKSDIVNKLQKEEDASQSEILTCYDLELSSGDYGTSDDDGFRHSLQSGLWVLYGMAREYPKVPRLVVTGFRSLDLKSHAAGGHAYLLKPYTPGSDGTLGKQIENASSIRSVTWLCPRGVQEDYESLFDEEDDFTFNKLVNQIRSWLDHRRIGLEVEEVMPERLCSDQRAGLASSDLIVVDVLGVGNTLDPHWDPLEDDPDPVWNPLDTIEQVRAINPDATLLMVVPAMLPGEATMADHFQGLPLHLRDGTDAIIRKPFWPTAEGHPDSEAGLANKIVTLLDKQDDYDVKFQVLIPVSAILGHYSNPVKNINNYFGKEWLGEGKTPADEIFAPFLPLLVQSYGLSARLKDLANLEIKDDLCCQIRESQKQDEEQWEGVENDKIERVVSMFVETAIGHKSIQKHLTLETWMRNMVDQKARDVQNMDDGRDVPNEQNDGDNEFSDISALTRPLARTFGGSTRYEFSVRGSWYPSGSNQRVDDILIVVEFCARSSVVARHIIKDRAVHYLSRVANEKEVMVQEIPTDAHRWSDS